MRQPHWLHDPEGMGRVFVIAVSAAVLSSACAGTATAPSRTSEPRATAAPVAVAERCPVDTDPPPMGSVDIASRKVAQLPAGPLYWRLETFPSLAAAQAAVSPTSLVGEAEGMVWLFTLGRKAETAAGGTYVADVGPLAPVQPAGEYLLRATEGIAKTGTGSEVHSHPGSESWYVLAGQQTVCTVTGVYRTEAGQSAAGWPGGTAQRVLSTGTVDRRAFALFVLDAGRPIRAPAVLSLPDATPASQADLAPRREP